MLVSDIGKQVCDFIVNDEAGKIVGLYEGNWDSRFTIKAGLRAGIQEIFYQGKLINFVHALEGFQSHLDLTKMIAEVV